MQIRIVRVYGLLAGLLAGMYGAMAVRGFNLGLYSDVLAYIYHYDTRGIRGGMNWLVMEHWERHLAAALASAPIQVLFPGNDDVWYAVALAIHFTTAFVFFAFLDDWQQGRYRMITFAAALLFAFEILQIDSHLTFATATHRKSALLMSVLSLWAYVRYVRGQRQQLVFYNVSWFLFALAAAIYEQAMLFFLLHPILAALEEWQQPIACPRWRYGLRLITEMLPYGLFVVGYVYLIDILFISSNVEASPGYVVGQIWTAIRVTLNPLAIIGRAAPAWQGGWALLSFGLAVLIGLCLWWLRPRTQQATPWVLLGMGVGLALLNFINVAPTAFSVARAPRLIYTASLGSGLIFAGLLAFVVNRIPSKQAGNVVYVVGIAILVASGATRFFQLQGYYLERDAAREQVKAAIYEVLPAWDEEEPPYLLIYSDAHPFDDLALYAQDINFPFMFDLMYGVEGILADAVYPDIDAPPETSGQHIIATEDGIISPLRQEITIDPARLVVIHYESASQTASVVERVPPEVIAAGNLHTEVAFAWETNDAYLD